MNKKILLKIKVEELNKLFTENSFTHDYFRRSNDGSYWIRVFILDKNGVSIGRLTYQYIHEKLKLYYIKSYKKIDYGYTVSDNIFYQLQYYFATGECLNSMDSLIKKAQLFIDTIYKKNIEWRKAHPHPNNKKRRKLQKRNLRQVLDDFVEKEIHNTIYNKIN